MQHNPFHNNRREEGRLPQGEEDYSNLSMPPLEPPKLVSFFEKIFHIPVVPSECIGSLQRIIGLFQEKVVSPLIREVAEGRGMLESEVKKLLSLQFASGNGIDLAIFIPFLSKEGRGLGGIPALPLSSLSLLNRRVPLIPLSEKRFEELKGRDGEEIAGLFLLQNGGEKLDFTLLANFKCLELLMKSFQRAVEEEGNQSMSIIKSFILMLRAEEVRRIIAKSMLDKEYHERTEMVSKAMNALSEYMFDIGTYTHQGMPLWKQIGGQFITTVSFPELPDESLYAQPELILPPRVSGAPLKPKSYIVRLIEEECGVGVVKVEPTEDHLMRTPLH